MDVESIRSLKTSISLNLTVYVHYNDYMSICTSNVGTSLDRSVDWYKKDRNRRLDLLPENKIDYSGFVLFRHVTGIMV